VWRGGVVKVGRCEGGMWVKAAKTKKGSVREASEQLRFEVSCVMSTQQADPAHENTHHPEPPPTPTLPFLIISPANSTPLKGVPSETIALAVG